MDKHILMFDIPVEMKSLARRVQRILRANNVEMWQQSVWVGDELQYYQKLPIKLEDMEERLES